MSHLVIGASGLVGSALMAELGKRALEAAGADAVPMVAATHLLDIRNPGEVWRLLGRLRPRFVYLPAALTNVDYCESGGAESYAVNVVGALHVVQAAAAVNARLVYFSSDYIFDGRDGPYGEEAPPNPLCVYGRHKLIAEHIVALQAPEHLILRTTVVFGWERRGKNFVVRLRDTLAAGKAVRVAADQMGNPTYAPALAGAAVDLAEAGAQGVFHVAGPERLSRFEFAREVALAFGLDAALIEPAATRELGQIASRPLNAGLRTDKFRASLGFSLPDCREALLRMVSERGV